jgi:transcriptional regulator
MYIPAQFAETRLDVLHELIGRHPLGTLIASTESGLEANHVPFLLSEATSTNGVLRCHVARANSIWKSLSEQQEVLVVFQGEGAYVSPSLYEAKAKDGKVVPTWNYIAVHAYGAPRIVTDPAWLHGLISDLTDTHEAAREAPWRVSDAPSDYIAKLLGAIVGIEIPITRLLGKWKVSQNRASTDRARVAADLSDSAPEMSSIVAGTTHV